MGGLFLKWFMGGGWKTIVGALLVGGFIAGIATLYGAWQTEKGQSALYKAERDASRLQLSSCVTVNEEWDQIAKEWNQAVADMQAESEGYLARLAAERARRRATESRLSELEAELSDQITAPDCEGALDQLVTALGWGPS